MDGLANYLAGHGYIGVTFDFVGHKLGASGGEMRHITDAAENLRDALHWLRTESKAENIVLIGHSLGGACAVQVAAWERQNPAVAGPKLAGIVALCIGREPARGFDLPIGKKMQEMRQDYVSGAPVRTLMAELNEMVLSAREVGDLPALFVAAKQDVLIMPERIAALAEMVGPHTDFQAIEAQHLDAPDRARGLILQWLEAQGL
jgi:pimeloyl-ACP methyl ester carboxylesterase